MRSFFGSDIEERVKASGILRPDESIVAASYCWQAGRARALNQRGLRPSVVGAALVGSALALSIGRPLVVVGAVVVVGVLLTLLKRSGARETQPSGAYGLAVTKERLLVGETDRPGRSSITFRGIPLSDIERVSVSDARSWGMSVASVVQVELRDAQEPLRFEFTTSSPVTRNFIAKLAALGHASDPQ